MAPFNLKMVVFAAILVCMKFHSSVGDVNIVGDDKGWMVPNDPKFYDNWQSKDIFRMNDQLVFNFKTGSQDVAIVDKEGYDKCKPNPRYIIKRGPAIVNLTEPGWYYFICSFKNHCKHYQKLAVYVIFDGSK
ncbi:umecyanin-like [Rutidosis leptorrhynchoides]|uniref:umecyanin-like n=1 Tax=Rutidosis leptorrhynchoides TaxID=125765 RepID=UPI003A9927D5